MASPKLMRASLRPGKTVLILLGATAAAGSAYRVFWSPEPETRDFNTSTFTPCTIISKEEVSPTSSIFRLRPQKNREAVSEAIAQAFTKGVWSIQIKQPQLQIARNYTPIPISYEESKEGEVQLLIRREKGGEVSNYLHDLPERSTVSIRGPYTELDIPQDVTEILFLAGGTGIAPAMQIARLLNERKHMSVHIFWANRTREDCIGGAGKAFPETTNSASRWRSWFQKTKPPTAAGVTPGLVVQTIEDLRSQNPQLKVDYYVDEEQTFIKPHEIANLVQTSLNATKSRRLILISGPDGFVEYWAGRKVWSDGRETQGPLGGQLGNMELKDWLVIKL